MTDTDAIGTRVEPEPPRLRPPGPPTELRVPPPREVPAAGPRPANRVYEHLVEGDDDVIGLVAYALYKQDKRDWLATWRRQHSGEPTDDQIDAFIATQMSFGQRDRYRVAARQVLDAYAATVVDVERPAIVQGAVSQRIESAATRVENASRWWRQLPAAFIGALLFAVIIVAIVVALVAAGVDVLSWLQPGSDAA
jgi:hypothetical protein